VHARELRPFGNLAAAPWPPAINAKLSIQIHRLMRKTLFGVDAEPMMIMPAIKRMATEIAQTGSWLGF